MGGDLLAVADSGNRRVLFYTAGPEGVAPRGEVRVPEVPFPIRVAVLPGGEVLALDGRTRRIARLHPERGFLGWLEPAGAEGRFVPRSLAAGADGRLHVLDVGGARVLVLSAEGRVEASAAFPPEARSPSDLAVDARGDVYVVDSVARRVLVWRRGEPALAPLTPSLDEDLEFPTSIAADDEGRIYVADQDGGGVVVLGRDGSFRGRHLAMGWKEGFLRYPADLCVGPGGTLFVAERGNDRVQVFATR